MKKTSKPDKTAVRLHAVARRLGVKLRIGNPGRRWGRYLCVTANGGPECDSAPGWEIVDWMPSLTEGKGFWYRQMFDGDVVGWMTLPALRKSPSDPSSATAD